MRILITGATGFIGTHLSHALVNAGHELIALVRNEQKAQALPQENVHILKGDLSLFQDPNLVLPPCDLVIHLAGIIVAPRVSDYARYNLEAVGDMIACLRRQKWRPRRILFSSSLAASGPSQPGRPHCEGNSDQPGDAYGQSKLDAERYLEREAPCPVTSFRPGAVYGPGDPAFLTIFKMAARGIGFRVAGLNPGFSYVYVQDLVDAILKLAEDESGVHRTYFTTHPDNATIDQMWDELRRAMERKIFVFKIPKSIFFLIMLGSTATSKVLPFKNQLDIKQYQQLTAPDFTCTPVAIQRDFNWQPQYDLASCIEKTTAGYREAGWL